MTKNSSSIGSSSDELLATKLEIPLIGARIVQRQRLTHLLELGLERRLTLLIAPAGYGKTTLLGEWVSTLPAADIRAAWVSLDGFDNTPLRLWSYITAAIRKAYPKLHYSVENIVKRGYDPEDFTVLHALFNEIAQIPYSICLILDDYQVITDDLIHRNITYLIEHQPANLHLILASRAMPPIPLARLRTQRQLLEISAHDLAFTLPEAKTFLASVMELDLPVAQVSALVEATEGWVAGLQLTALSCQGHSHYLPVRPDGGSRQIFDYLSEEVLNRQPTAVREFLLFTSILTTLSAPLCDAVLQRTDSEEILTRVERRNLFIVCLDDDRRWFRYHTLFAEALQRHLERTHPEQLNELHRRACAWLLERGYSEQAVSHAFAAGDLEHAAEILDSCAMRALMKFDKLSLMQWISGFSEEMINRRPHLGVYRALTKYQFGRIDLMEQEIQMIEKALDQVHVSSDTTGQENLVRWEIKVIRAAAEFLKDNYEEGIRQCLEALQAAPPGDTYFSGFTSHSLACAFETTGQLDAAAEYFEKGIQFAQKQELAVNFISSCCKIAGIRKLQGRLRDAEHEYQRALDSAIKSGAFPGMPKTGLIEIAYEKNLIGTAENLAKEVVDYVDRVNPNPPNSIDSGVIAIRLAQIYLIRGDLENAEAYFQKALSCVRNLDHTFGLPIINVIDVQVRLWVASGKVNQDFQILQEKIENLGSERIARPAKQTVFARIHLAQGHPDEALTLLKDLEANTRSKGVNGPLIEIMVMQALAYQMKEQESLALEALADAIRLAAPEGYVRFFIEAGGPMLALLKRFVAMKTSDLMSCEELAQKIYAEKLIVAFKESPSTPRVEIAGLAPQITRIAAMPEPLSAREIEVLTMLVAGKTMREVAAALMVSFNTSKAHTKNIYRKLGAHNRKALIQRAAELGIH